MSTVSWGIVGYGVCTDNIKTTAGHIEDLLAHAPQFRQDVYDYFAEQEITSPDLDDYLDYDQDYMTGIAYLIGKVVEEAENVHLAWDTCEDGNCYIMFPASYPWMLNQKEKNMTEEHCRVLLAKYISILTDQELQIKYINTINYG